MSIIDSLNKKLKELTDDQLNLLDAVIRYFPDHGFDKMFKPHCRLCEDNMLDIGIFWDYHASSWSKLSNVKFNNSILKVLPQVTVQEKGNISYCLVLFLTAMKVPKGYDYKEYYTTILNELSDYYFQITDEARKWQLVIRKG